MSQRKQYIKDDSKLSRLVAEEEAERKRLGLERKPPDFKAATEFALSLLSGAAHRETKDDTSLRLLVEEAEAERKRLGLERKPPDFKAATEFALAQLAAIAHREPETIEVSLRVVNGQVEFEPSDHISTRGNELWVEDKRIVVKVAE